MGIIGIMTKHLVWVTRKEIIIFIMNYCRNQFLHKDELEVGKYYALASSQKVYMLAHIVNQDINTWGTLQVAETIMAYQIDNPNLYRGYNFRKVIEISSITFNKALDLYSRGKNMLLSLTFDKELVKGARKRGKYYYLTKKSGDIFIFTRIMGYNGTDGVNDINVIEINNTEDSFSFWVIPDEYEDSDYECYSIEARTFEKAVKIHDMVNQALISLIVTCFM